MNLHLRHQACRPGLLRWSRSPVRALLILLLTGTATTGWGREEQIPDSSPTPTALPATAPSPPPLPTDPAELLNLLNEGQITRAIAALREGFIQPGATSERELLRAQMAGLIQRLGPGLRLVNETEPPKAPENASFLAEIIDGRIGYIRPGGISAGDLTQMDTLLGEFQEKGLRSLVLDLRGVRSGADFEAAAEMARRFAPRGRMLFRLEKPSAKQERIFTANQDAVFTGAIVVIIGPHTAGAAEVLAAALRQSAGAMILGQSSRGQPVEFSRASLGGGVALEMAVAEAILPENQRLFPRGVQPDLVLPATPERETELLRLAGERGVSGLIFEQERPRLNEAALIANANPEIDGSAEANRSHLGETRDATLQRAVDILTALQLFSP